METKGVFSIWNYHKCLSYLFLIPLNTYVMSPRTWYIFLVLQCGNRLQTSESDVYRRQILTSKVDPRAVRVNIYIIINCLDPSMQAASFARPARRWWIGKWGGSTELGPWMVKEKTTIFIYAQLDQPTFLVSSTNTNICRKFTIISTLQTLCVVCRTIPKFLSEKFAQLSIFCVKSRGLRGWWEIKVRVGPVVHKLILRFIFMQLLI